MSQTTQIIADDPVQNQNTVPEEQTDVVNNTATSDWTWLYISVGVLALLLLFAALITVLVMYRRASSGEDVPLLGRWLTKQQKREAEEEGVNMNVEDLDDF